MQKPAANPAKKQRMYRLSILGSGRVQESVVSSTNGRPVRSMPELRTRIESLQSLFESTEETGCGCVPTFREDVLVVDASQCTDDGRLTSSAMCRETVIDALTHRDATRIETVATGIERTYHDEAANFLVAAGRFAEAVDFHDERLAVLAKRDPLAAAREATGRADAPATLVVDTGLAACSEGVSTYREVLDPAIGPPVSRWRVEQAPPASAQLRDVRQLPTGGTVRLYETQLGLNRYHLEPLEATFDTRELEVLEEAYERLANGEFEGGDRAPARAVRAVVMDRRDHRDEGPPDSSSGGSQSTQFDSTPPDRIARVLRKHARGFGLLEDFFADPACSDAFVTAPASENRLRVTVDGRPFVSNVRLTDRGVAALSSRFRRESGRAFSRADPTLDATADVAGRRLRIAGVTKPTSRGAAFAFRARDREIWTLPALVQNETLSERAAALLSVAIERGRAVLTAGPRGAGKTTLLGALLWEISPAVRTVVIEDTPELPVSSLQEVGRDVQALLASDEHEELSMAEALRTALRLGNGALAVGEVRGEEAAVLYEAMRVGASSEAVLGTIHGDGGDAVYERVVADLGVQPSSFGVTDLVVTCEITEDRIRRVKAIEEVVGGEAPTFEPLFEQQDSGLAPTGRIDRGNSPFVAGLATPTESYADVRALLAARTNLIAGLAARHETDGEAVTEAHHLRGR